MPNYADQVVQIGAIREPYKSMSRIVMGRWYGQWSDTPVTVATLSTAVLYANLLEDLFPGCVDKRKLKHRPRGDWEKTQNWIVVQRAMDRLKIDKRIEPSQLAKATSAAGFEFAKWFVCFFEKNANEV